MKSGYMATAWMNLEDILQNEISQLVKKRQILDAYTYRKYLE